MHLRNGYLDQWRGISVLMVVVDHLLLFRLPVSPLRFENPTAITGLIARAADWMQAWATAGGIVGVCVFFVLSGYLITSLMIREEQLTGRVSLRNFVIRRVFRIFPALLFFLAALWLLHAVGAIHMRPRDAFGLDLLLCNTSAVDCGHMGHFWTLAVEEQFYLLWPLVFVFSGRMRVTIITFALIASLVASTLPSLRIHGWMNNGLGLACISSGTLFATSPNFRSMFRWTCAVPRGVWIAALIVAMPLALSRWPHFDAALVLLVPGLVVSTVLVRANATGGRAAEVLRRIGLVSCSLYLWHAILTWSPETYLTTWFSLASVLAVPAALFSYRFIEIPMVAIGRRLAGSDMTARAGDVVRDEPITGRLIRADR